MVRVGTSGWHYPAGKGTWNGVFYPARRPRGFDERRYYAGQYEREMVERYPELRGLVTTTGLPI